MPSSVIKYFNYNPSSSTLTIHYVSGMVYEYFQVPEKIYNSMKQSKSKGTFLNKFIKGKFDYKKID